MNGNARTMKGKRSLNRRAVMNNLSFVFFPPSLAPSLCAVDEQATPACSRTTTNEFSLLIAIFRVSVSHPTTPHARCCNDHTSIAYTRSLATLPKEGDALHYKSINFINQRFQSM